MKAELTDAKRRIAKLEHESSGAGRSAVSAAGAGVAAVGAVGLLVALQKKLGRSHHAALDRVRAELEAEQVRQQAALAAEQEQAACRQADLERQVAALNDRVT